MATPIQRLLYVLRSHKTPTLLVPKGQCIDVDCRLVNEERRLAVSIFSMVCPRTKRLKKRGGMILIQPQPQTVLDVLFSQFAGEDARRKHLDKDDHGLNEQSIYWRNNLPRLIAKRAGLSELQSANIPEEMQFRAVEGRTSGCLFS